jgi:hypothetical protein
MHAEEAGPPLRCTKCDAFRRPLLRLEDDSHPYCENCFAVSGDLVLKCIDDQGVEVWRRRRSA